MNPKKNRPAFRALTAAGQPGDPQGFAHAIGLYLESRAVRGFLSRTIDGQSRDLEYFVIWAEARGLTRPTDITRPILERYQRTLFYYRKKNGRPLAFSTQRQRLQCLRGLFSFLARQSRILYNPASDLDLPRTHEHLPPPVLTAAEVEQILALPDVNEPFGCRDRALLETLYSTGMRRSELVYLKLADVDTARGTVYIHSGKGGKDRIIPIGERALAWLDRYLTESRPQLVIAPDDGFLFLTYLGQSFDPDHLSYLVARYIDRADLGKKGSCHLFRHTVATLMLDAGADCRYVQELLGHSQLSTTQIYLSVSINKLKAVHAATHPAAFLKPSRPGPEPPLAPTPAPIIAVSPAAPPGPRAAELEDLGPVRTMGPRSAGSRRAFLAALDEEAGDEDAKAPDVGDRL